MLPCLMHQMTSIRRSYQCDKPVSSTGRRYLLLYVLFFAICSLGISGCGINPTPHNAAIYKPLFSEDFESGKLDSLVWSSNITGANQIQVESNQVAHGKYALMVQCPAPSQRRWAFISMKNLPVALRSHYFGRVYMLISPSPPARHTILIMGGTGGFPRNTFEEVATTNGQWQLTYVDLQPNGDHEDYHIGGGAIPLGRWFCLEWEFNDHPNHARVWVDGKFTYETDFTSKAHGTNTDLIGGFTDFAVGFRLWGAAPRAFDVYFDDIALDTKRIGQISER